MFRKLARFQAIRRAYSTSSSKPTKLAGIGAGSLALFGAGLVFGKLASSPGKSEILAHLSTTPLNLIDPPQYATEEEFNRGLAEIIAIVGEENTTLNRDVIASHSDTFYSTHHPPDPENNRPHIIVYPDSTEHVSGVLKVANKYRIPIIANSGLTSLEGQNMHTRGPYSISVSFDNLNKVLDFHPDDLDVVVQPGVGWQELDDFLKDEPEGKHLIFGPDPGIGAAIGGMVATSASGTNAYKYGTMKENVVNLTVVLADGKVLKTKQRPRKSSAGYDLTRLFIGSEGTLGIITEITVKLGVRPKEELVCIAAFPDIKDAALTAQEIISKSGLSLNAIEILDHTMMSFVNDSSSSKKYLEKPTLFFKIGGRNEEEIQNQIKAVLEIASRNRLISFEKAKDAQESQELWSARRHGLWSTVEFGRKILPDPTDVQVWTTDFAVPISRMAQLISETNEDLNANGFLKRFSVMGHVGDGNCHFLLLYNSKDYAKAQAAVDRMVNRAIAFEGTCTGEHGVGVGKRLYLPKELGENSVDLMRHIKLAMDPHRILNPDKIFKIDPEEKLDELLHSGHVHEVHSGGCC